MGEREKATRERERESIALMSSTRSEKEEGSEKPLSARDKRGKSDKGKNKKKVKEVSLQPLSDFIHFVRRKKGCS